MKHLNFRSWLNAHSDKNKMGHSIDAETYLLQREIKAQLEKEAIENEQLRWQKMLF